MYLLFDDLTCNCLKQFIKYQTNQRCLLGIPWFTGAGEREAGPSEPGPQDFGIYSGLSNSRRLSNKRSRGNFSRN